MGTHNLAAPWKQPGCPAPTSSILADRTVTPRGAAPWPTPLPPRLVESGAHAHPLLVKSANKQQLLPTFVIDNPGCLVKTPYCNYNSNLKGPHLNRTKPWLFWSFPGWGSLESSTCLNWDIPQWHTWALAFSDSKQINIPPLVTAWIPRPLLPVCPPPNTQSLEDQSLRVLVSDNQPRNSVGSLEGRFAPARNKYNLIQKYLTTQKWL